MKSENIMAKTSPYFKPTATQGQNVKVDTGLIYFMLFTAMKLTVHSKHCNTWLWLCVIFRRLILNKAHC